MQSENTLQEETAEVYKAVKMLCAQYQVPQNEMRAWMDAVNAFDQYGHGMISTVQVGLAIQHVASPTCCAQRACYVHRSMAY